MTPHRLELLRFYYAKFGILTFIAGRFFPGGVRNALFMSSGLTKMPFHLFILRDGLACVISTLTLFYIGYQFGQNLDLILDYFHRYTHWFFIAFAFIGLIAIIYFTFRRERLKKE